MKVLFSGTFDKFQLCPNKNFSKTLETPHLSRTVRYKQKEQEVLDGE